jgi:hypothetical protein
MLVYARPRRIRQSIVMWLITYPNDGRPGDEPARPAGIIADAGGQQRRITGVVVGCPLGQTGAVPSE